MHAAISKIRNATLEISKAEETGTGIRAALDSSCGALIAIRDLPPPFFEDYVTGSLLEQKHDIKTLLNRLPSILKQNGFEFDTAQRITNSLIDKLEDYLVTPPPTLDEVTNQISILRKYVCDVAGKTVQVIGNRPVMLRSLFTTFGSAAAMALLVNMGLTETKDAVLAVAGSGMVAGIAEFVTSAEEERNREKRRERERD